MSLVYNYKFDGIKKPPMLRFSENFDAAVSQAATIGMGGGTTTSVFGWLTSNQAVALLGILVTTLGFFINLHFQARNDRRLQKEADLRYSLELAEDQRQKELHAAQLAALGSEKVNS